MPASPFLCFFRPLSGLVFWAAQFALIYAATALACARGGARFAGAVPLVIAATTLLALAAAASFFFGAWRRRQDDAAPADTFLDALTLWANGLAFVAIAWNALPALVLRVCE